MIKFLKVRDVASPEREDGNVGFDFFVPKFTKEFREDCQKEAEKNPKAGCYFSVVKDNGETKTFINVPAHGRVSIPSGIKSYLKLNRFLRLFHLQMDLFVENKSGIATKKGLDVGACEIDPNYQGEIHLSLTNTTDEDIKIFEGDKITQLAPRVYVTGKAKVYSEIDTPEEKFWKGFKYHNRGNGGFGSIGTKAK